MGAAHGNGVHYQNLSSHGGLGGPPARVQVGPNSQVVLPPIAPRPSPPMLQNGTAPSPAMGEIGLLAAQYNLFGYTFDGQTFAESDLPPRMRQQTTQRELPYDHSQTTADAGRPHSDRFQPLHYPNQQSNIVLESGNGVDLGHLGHSSTWSQRSTASTGGPISQFNQAQLGVSPTSEDQPLHKHASLPQALFPPHSDQQFPEHWLSQSHESYQTAPWDSIQVQNNTSRYSQDPRPVHPNDISPTSHQGFHGAVQDIARKWRALRW